MKEYPICSYKKKTLRSWASMAWVSLCCFGVFAFGAGCPQVAVKRTVKITKKAKVNTIHPKNLVELWSRKNGQHMMGEVFEKDGLIKVDLTKLEPRSLKRKDLQYGKDHFYKGVTLSDLIGQYEVPGTVDLALLHFRNKMIVPYPLASTGEKKLDVFVAYAFKETKSASWTRNFPKVSKKSIYKDLHPLTFYGNKVVVSSRWHPYASKDLEKSFTPWRHVTSLVGIEFVQAAAYYKQFQVSEEAEVVKGYQQFFQVCQFCHGAHRIGASLGWDFVTPMPIYKYRSSPNELSMHIRYRAKSAAAQGLMMPALKDMKKADIVSLWSWIRAIAKNKPKAYQP